MTDIPLVVSNWVTTATDTSGCQGRPRTVRGSQLETFNGSNCRPRCRQIRTSRRPRSSLSCVVELEAAGSLHSLIVDSPGEPDFGSQMGATTRSPVRSDAVSVTAYSVLSRANTSYQPACTGVRVVRDEEAAGSNPATPTSSEGI